MARRRTARGNTKPRGRQQSAGPSAAPARPVGIGGPVGAGHPPTGSQAADAADVEPQALVVSHWFDSGDGSEPYSATVRFTGRRVGTRGEPRSRDAFVQDETIDGIVPGTGPVSITTWVYGLEPGDWTVTGDLIWTSDGAGGSANRLKVARPVAPAAWSWRRWAVSTGPEVPAKTRWAPLAPLARQPAVIPGIYTALAIASIVLALVIQQAILAPSGVSTGGALLASVVAIALGLVGAKLLYAALHPKESILRGGWAVDGFLLVFPIVASVALLLLDLPIGTVFDASTPGIFFAVAIGRIGCFLTGCCSGRCTASRWGIWSSDRRVGARRIPTQLMESAVGLALGLVTLILVLGGSSPFPGAVFLAAFAVYALFRQGLLRLRSERRTSQRSLPLTAAAAGLVVVAVAVLSLLQGA